MDKLLKVVKVEILHSDKAKCDFKKVTFKGVKFLGGREVFTNASGVRNMWPDHMAMLHDGPAMIKGDADYDTVNTNDLFDGEIVSFKTTPYKIDGGNGQTITNYKTVVFATENPLVVAARNLRQNNAKPYDEETGEVFTLQTFGTGVATGEGAAATSVEP